MSIPPAGDRERSGGSPARGRGEGGGLDETRAVFMISVAAELAAMHPQTLRMYEARGLITPKRSKKNTRLYSLEDVERLRRIQRMTADEGLNLAGVETVLGLERELERARSELRHMRKRAREIERRMLAEIEAVKRSFRAEIVPYGAYEPLARAPSGPRPGAASPAGRRVRIPVERTKGGRPPATEGDGGSPR
jgi:MerR family transcriptional regulator/heat shock protein HspR